MDLDGIRHFEHLQQEKARVRALASKSMSPAALARLPKPIVIRREEVAPVVLATKEHAISPRYQESARLAARTLAAHRAKTRPILKVKRIRGWRIGLQNGRADVTADRVLFAKIVDLAAQASGLPAYDLHDFKRSRQLVPVRHMCWLLLREFTGLSSGAIARITGRGCHSSIINGIGRALSANKKPDGAALYWEVRTRLSGLGYAVVDELSDRP